MNTGKMHWLISDSWGLLMHDKGPPTDQDWQHWLAEYKKLADDLQGLLVYSLGGSPTPVQRGELIQFLASRSTLHRTAMITPSPLVRGALTAVNWFVKPMLRAVIFAPSQLEAAFDHIGLERTMRAPFRQKIERQLATWSAETSARV
jgi:hypothetical protein